MSVDIVTAKPPHRSVPLRWVLVPLAVVATSILLVLVVRQLILVNNAVEVEAEVVDRHSSLARLKGGALNIELTYQFDDKKFKRWHTLSRFEAFPKIGSKYKMICHKNDPEWCEGQGPGSWILVGMALFFAVLCWSVSAILWRRRVMI